MTLGFLSRLAYNSGFFVNLQHEQTACHIYIAPSVVRALLVQRIQIPPVSSRSRQSLHGQSWQRIVIAQEQRESRQRRTGGFENVLSAADRQGKWQSIPWLGAVQGCRGNSRLLWRCRRQVSSFPGILLCRERVQGFTVWRESIELLRESSRWCRSCAG